MNCPYRVLNVDSLVIQSCAVVVVDGQPEFFTGGEEGVVIDGRIILR